MESYEVSIFGMKCGSCSGKIEEEVTKLKGVENVRMNLLFNKMVVSVSQADYINIVVDTIVKLGYEVKFKNKIQLSNEVRTIRIKTTKLEKLSLKFIDLLKNMQGILKLEVEIAEESQYINIEYSWKIIKGSDIIDKFHNSTINFEYTNDLDFQLNSIGEEKDEYTVKNLVICVLLTSLILYMNMLIDENFYNQLHTTYLVSRIMNVHLIICFLLNGALIYKFGISIYKRAYISFTKYRQTSMDTLIAIGSISALGLALVVFIRLIADREVFESSSLELADSLGTSSLVIGISTIGKYVEDLAKKYIKRESGKLIFSEEANISKIKYSKIEPKSRCFWFEGETKYDAGLFEEEDFIKLETGSCMLLDCIVMSGQVEINDKFNQGFDSSILKSVGEKIRSGAIINKIVGESSCIVAVEMNLNNSKFFKLTEIMIDSMNQKLKFQNSIEQITRYFVPVIISLAILTFIIWSFIKSYDETGNLTWFFILRRSITMIVVSCPCAFGLAIPTVTSIALSKALGLGILVKNVALLPEIYKTKVVVFDKTGTLTEIAKNVAIEYEDESFPLTNIVGTIEASQKHPIAEALYSYCLKINKLNLNNSSIVTITKNAAPNSVSDQKQSSGIEVSNDGIKSEITTTIFQKPFDVFIGNYNYISSLELEINSELKLKIDDCSSSHLSIVFVATKEKIIGLFSIDTSSSMRAESKGVINYLNNRGIGTCILSGDEISVVKGAGESLGVRPENVFGGKSPEEKREVLMELKKKYGDVLMIGDGVNDVISLSASDYGVSFNPNSSLNMISSEVIISKEDLSLIISLLDISKYSFYFIWINIFWAFGYNLLMIPMTSGFMSSIIEFDVSPQLGSMFMLLSSILIVFNSSLLLLVNFNKFKGTHSELKTKAELESDSKYQTNQYRELESVNDFVKQSLVAHHALPSI